MLDWLNVLDGIKRDHIARACDAYLRDQPRRRPTPADIRQKALGIASWDARFRAPPSRQIEPPRTEPRVSAEEASRICEMAGFTPRRAEALARRRMATSMQEATAETGREAPPHWTAAVSEDSPEMAALRAARASNTLVQEARQVSAAQARLHAEGAAK